MIKKIIFTVILIFIFLGCSKSAIGLNTPDFNQNFDNTNHVVGNKEIAIAKVIYIKKDNSVIKERITFYIDKFPYDVSFELFSSLDIKTIKSVTINSKGERKFTYVKNPDTKSHLFLNKELEGHYTLVFLDRTNVFIIDEQKSYLPVKHIASTNSFIVNKNYTKQNNIETYWYSE